MPLEQCLCRDIFPELLRRLGEAPGIHLQKTAQKMASTACTLGAPQFSWELYHLSREGETPEKVALYSGTELRGVLSPGGGIRHLREASRGFVAVCSLGPSLEAEAENLQGRGNLLEAYLLTLGGNLLLDAASRQAREKARKLGEAEGLCPGPTLLPGSLRGWPPEEQELLLGLGSAEKLGVRYLPGGMLFPLQSLSFLIGLGSYLPDTPAALCGECLRKESCPWRRET